MTFTVEYQSGYTSMPVNVIKGVSDVKYIDRMVHFILKDGRRVNIPLYKLISVTEEKNDPV